MIKVLSLHFTTECSRCCPNCYMRAKSDGTTRPASFFFDLLPAARALEIDQVALGGGEPSLFPAFVAQFCERATENGIIVNMTSNGDGLTPDRMASFAGLTMISVSMDRFKISGMEAVERTFDTMDRVRAAGLTVGCNLQLDPYLVAHLYPMLARILAHADYVYLLQSKPSNLELGAALRKRLLGVTLAFGRVFVDDSILLGLGRKPSCSRGVEIVSVDHAGRVSPCSFDTPLATLERGAELVELVRERYPFEPTHKCPFLSRPRSRIEE